MCVAIFKPARAVIPEANLIACGTKNPHGWGIMFVDAGEVRVLKSMKLDDFLPIYRKLSDRDLGIHFRYRTDGKIDLANAHPYRVLRKKKDGRDLWLMHNGVIRMTGMNTAMSDTWHYIQSYLKPILTKHPELLQNAAFVEMLEDHISGSKFLFLDDKGRFKVLNEKSGTSLFGGCWFSNSHSHNLPYVYNQGGSPSSAGVGFHRGHVWNKDNDEWDEYGYYGGYYRPPVDQSGPNGHSTVIGGIARGVGNGALATVSAAATLFRRPQAAPSTGSSPQLTVEIGPSPAGSSFASAVATAATSAADEQQPAQAETVGAEDGPVAGSVSGAEVSPLRPEPEPSAMAEALFPSKEKDEDIEDDEDDEDDEKIDDTIYEGSVAALLMDATQKAAHDFTLDDLNRHQMTMQEIKVLCEENPLVVAWLLHNELSMLYQLGR